jgi:sulfopyruvate decarboxylase TPP-binding subunit
MPVSALNSQVVYDALKANGIRLLSVLPETWLVHLVGLAEEDPEMVLVLANVSLIVAARAAPKFRPAQEC